MGTSQSLEVLPNGLGEQLVCSLHALSDVGGQIKIGSSKTE